MRWWLVLIAIGCSESDENPASDTADPEDPAPAWPAAWSTLEDDVLRLVNGHRFTGATCGTDPMPGGLGALESDPVLRRLARAHSEDMSDRGFFDHVNPDGDDPFDRFIAADFTGSSPWGENIALGPPDAESVVGSWMDSPGHCANIMEPGFAVIGVGYFGESGGPWWTQNFAGSH